MFIRYNIQPKQCSTHYLPQRSSSLLASSGDTRVGPVLNVGLGVPLGFWFLRSLLGFFRGSSSTSLLGSVLLNLLRVSVEVQVGHNRPLLLSVWDDASQSQHLSGQQPPDQTDRVLTLVVTWDGHVNVFGWGVHVGKSNDGDVDVGGLLDGLGIGSWVGDNHQSWLLERTGDVVGEVTWGESAGNWGGAGVGGKLQHGSLAEGSGGAHHDVRSVWNGGDDSGSQHDLLPGLGDVDHVNTVWSGLVDVRLVVDLLVSKSCEIKRE